MDVYKPLLVTAACMAPNVNDYCSTLSLVAAAELIRSTSGPTLILTHVKPDGDAFGSVIALTAALRSIDRVVSACFVPPVPASFLELRGSDLAIQFDDQTRLPDAALYLVLDTGAWAQLGPLRPVLEPNLKRTLIIDHHLGGDVGAAHRHIDPAAAACCELVAAICDRLLSEPMGESWARIYHAALFVGIASDTGWFRFSNTRPQTHELACRLLSQGVDHAAIYQQLEQAERPEKMALLIRALDSLELVGDGQAAVMLLRHDDFAQTGALEGETERLIDIPQQVGTIRVIVLVSERSIQADGPITGGQCSAEAGAAGGKARAAQGMVAGGRRIQTRLSFRSKPGPRAVNVAEMAQRFGGGGHARAAGATVDEPSAVVRARIVEALIEAVDSA